MSSSRQATSSAPISKQAALGAPSLPLALNCSNHTIELPSSKYLSSVTYTKSSRVFENVTAPDRKGSPLRVTVNIAEKSYRHYQDIAWGVHPIAQDLILLSILAMKAGRFWWLLRSDARSYGPRVVVRGPMSG